MQQLSVLASYGKCALHHAGTDQPPYMPVVDWHLHIICSRKYE
jgi:hypothetical protein